VIRAAIDRAPAGAVYCVADDRPSTQIEYARWLAEHLGVPVPEPNPPGAGTVPHRGRRVRNDKMKRELGVTLACPSFIEGEARIDAAERAAT
jgi:hypothetical protein